MEERAAFGELLRRYRLAAGLTREALAERTGLSVPGLSDLERGARLRGASEMLFDLSNKVPFPIWQLEPARTSAAGRAALGEVAFGAAVAAGRAMTSEQAVACALEGAGTA